MSSWVLLDEFREGPDQQIPPKHLCFLHWQRCELCPHKDGALKRTDNGGEGTLSLGWLSLLWLWKQGTVYSLVLGGVGSRACWPAEADPHTVPGWAHVVCALYIPEVQFANVLTMEPIVLQYVPHDRFNKVSGPSLVPS